MVQTCEDPWYSSEQESVVHTLVPFEGLPEEQIMISTILIQWVQPERTNKERERVKEEGKEEEERKKK